MKFAAAYLLCVLGGKDPTKENRFVLRVAVCAS
eukprot:COSAG06_NODE_56551_length_284_cov_0.827027_1_plen_32_part_01